MLPTAATSLSSNDTHRGKCHSERHTPVLSYWQLCVGGAQNGCCFIACEEQEEDQEEKEEGGGGWGEEEEANFISVVNKGGGGCVLLEREARSHRHQLR